jgi:putative Holliday junction resolvase
VCDPDGILATPLTTLQSKDVALKKQIAEIFEEYEPVKIYVGQPKLLSGEDGTAVAKVLGFTEMLTSNFDVPVILVDERLSTVSAARQLRESGISSKDARFVIDAAAAVAILEQGLANERK